ncbi:hypothetical protein ACNI3T_00580 [Christiangramia sp. ASW11-125]|uniref:hypothetical protein n=1 Tax=Christiangramia sp. ASW11-125 TaxID=3400701 RepID=UPI003AAD97E1
MKEEDIYKKVFNEVFSGLKTENHDKFYNTETKKLYEIDHLYPDIILTKKGTNDVNFIIEVIPPKRGSDINYILEKIKPISKLGGTFYLLVPKTEKNKIETLCRENDIHPRFGTYAEKGDELDILFE